MKKYLVLQNGRPACYPLSKAGWDKYPEFDSFDAAWQYVRNWLGGYAPEKPFELNQDFNYNGYDRIMIAEVEK